jgi:PAS domain S-box-containing protein
MNEAQFCKQNQLLQERIELLQEDCVAASKTSADLLPMALEELKTAFEALQVAEEELRLQNEELMVTRSRVEFERDRYQELFAFAPDGYLVTDQNGLIQEANQEATRLLGMSSQFLTGKTVMTFFPVDHRREMRTRLGNLASSLVQEWTTVIQPRAGEPFDTSIRAVMTAVGPDGLALIRWRIRAITPQKLVERQL